MIFSEIFLLKIPKYRIPNIELIFIFVYMLYFLDIINGLYK